MTREEEIEMFAEKVRISCLECGYKPEDAKDRAQAYAEGMRNADEHQKNPWRDAKKELPPRRKEGANNSNEVYIRYRRYKDYYYGIAIYNHELESWFVAGEVTNWMPIPELKK